MPKRNTGGRTNDGMGRPHKGREDMQAWATVRCTVTGQRAEEYSQLETRHIGLTTELEKRERILGEARRGEFKRSSLKIESQSSQSN